MPVIFLSRMAKGLRKNNLIGAKPPECDMCGVCGQISYNSSPVDEDCLRKMCRAFSYRGPDDEGIYIDGPRNNGNLKVIAGLGHRRLSIIDLSKAGHQPMSNEDGSIWITYNGEIYNFKELRTGLKRKGHTFGSDTDTEVILHLYEEKGLEAVNHLNGMFAFALWDRKACRLWLCCMGRWAAYWCTSGRQKGA